MSNMIKLPPVPNFLYKSFEIETKKEINSKLSSMGLSHMFFSKGSSNVVGYMNRINTIHVPC